MSNDLTRPPSAPRWMGPLRVFRPAKEAMATVYRELMEAPFTYAPVGGTRETMPEGWDHDEQWAVLGHGDEAWERACDALERWTMFDLDWVEPLDRDVPFEPGRAFAFLSHQLGVWTVNVCRVVYAFGGRDGESYGFAYGTVGVHVVRGEERFELRRDAAGEVSFGIRKFSRPAHLVLSLFGPVTRYVQRAFTRDALARMRAEVQA